MHIPEELLNLPTHVVELFLADLIPWDEEYKWNRYTNEQVHKWFSENFDERSYIIGTVRFCQIMREKYVREKKENI